jgi:ribonuclease HI
MNIIYSDGGTKGSRICMYDKQLEKFIVKHRYSPDNRSTPLTNNELEYLALIYSLEYCRNVYSKKKVVIKVDSLLVANQINGKWRVTTEHLIALYERSMKLLTKNISVSWISRDFNLAGHVLES